MLKKFSIIYSFNPGRTLLPIIIMIIFSNVLQSQTPTNLEVFYSLTDSLVDKIVEEIPKEKNKILLTLNLGQSYSLFSNSIRERFKESGKEILQQPPDDLNVPHIDIVMEGAGVEYGEMYRDGWFDSHYIPRHSVIFGNFLQTYSTEGKRNFEITSVDTVKVEDMKSLENESFPFTKGTVPAEPFISGFAEPLIAIGIAVAVVVLYFTIRSE